MNPMLLPALLGLILAAPAIITQPAQAQVELAQQTNRKGPLADLNLTPEQQQRMQQIRQNARTQMQQVLTPEQRQQLSQLQGQTPEQRRTSVKNLNLTDSQKAQMKQIRTSTRQQIETILTPEQRQQLEARRQQSRQRRGQPGNPNNL
ncbi:hypothetical protein GlitD10_0380 [Gloeomargarita lithophora Alchichica-D10]|uniref:P pilus assembly/Cpx signaling pathway, periplasmic inhibitor/zinc-resistance associated protein n=1 Tax=Gloeomargarita lithophora Alchichica-D10 TaxID=1188229 RepID=A0A1J0A9T6_9CYAN|nr:hypothetical protein [Gloeomargarita lithophora]APB32691.1 hypothetical protein GlitD10_0380 [Gloeomargarita lithophora Alchichica-D10]